MFYSFFFICFFFFKQKTAYEIRLSLVGSEMCIRDRLAKVIHDLSITGAFTGRYPFNPQSLRVNPYVLQQFPAQMHHVQRIPVSCLDVVALTQPATTNEYTVIAVQESPYYELRINSTSAHEPNIPNIWHIL